MRAEILNIGTELLIGQIVDTNSAYLARKLAEIGVDCHFRTAVGDNHLRACSALGLALLRADLVLITGGLGPTQDDITRDVVAAVLGRPLELHQEALEQIRQLFARMGRPFTDSQRKQALLPRGAQVIPNPVGTAPGLLVEHGNQVVICVPGVPREMTAMVEQTVLPYLAARQGAGVIRSRILRFCGIGEAALEARLADLVARGPNPTVAPYAGVGEVSLRLTAKAATAAEADALLAPLEAEILDRAGQYLYGKDSDTLESVVGRLLAGSRRTLSVAESCTGGLITHRLTNVPGSSAYLLESAVTYSNQSKVARLGVPQTLIDAHGAVSEPVARAMAEGVRRTAGSDVGLSVTGIAGPGGGTESKPVGLTFVAVSGEGRETRSEEHRFIGDRETIKWRAAQAALDLLRRYLKGP